MEKDRVEDRQLNLYLHYMEHPGDYSEGEGNKIRNEALKRFGDDSSKLLKWVQEGQEAVERKQEIYDSNHIKALEENRKWDVRKKIKDLADAHQENEKRTEILEKESKRWYRKLCGAAQIFSEYHDKLRGRPGEGIEGEFYDLGVSLRKREKYLLGFGKRVKGGNQ